MCRRQVTLTMLFCTAICTTLFGEAQTQLVKLPAVPFIATDCHPGDHQESLLSYGGPLRCLTNNPPPAPTCPAGSARASAPVWSGGTWSQSMCTVIPPPAPPPPPPSHVAVATATINSCGTLGAFNAYADGTCGASSPDWNQSSSGTQDQVSSNGTAYMNQNYTRYYQPIYIPQPPDPNTIT